MTKTEVMKDFMKKNSAAGCRGTAAVLDFQPDFR